MDADLLKGEYLVAYDYDAGAVWAIMTARSPNEIMNRFPQLKVYVSPPDWMPKEQLAGIRREGVIDINSGIVPEWMILSNEE